MKRSMLIFAASAMVALMSCSKEKEAPANVEPNPTYDPNTNTVKTEFVLSVSTANGKDTKTSPEFTQVDGTFLGMQDVHLLAYELPYESASYGHFFYTPVYNDAKVGSVRNFNLGSLIPSGVLDSEHSSRAIELSLPLGTNAVTLYGKALKTYSDEEQGKVDITGDADDMTSLKFSLCSRLTNQGAFDAGAFLFSRIFNYLLVAGAADERQGGFWNNPVGSQDKSYHFWFPLDSGLPEDTPYDGKVVKIGDVDYTYSTATGKWTPEPSAEVLDQLPTKAVDGDKTTVSGVEYTYYKGQLTWKQLGRMYDYEYDDVESTKSDAVATTESGINKMTLSPLGEVLGEAYSVLTTIKASTDGKYKELRAGSAPSVLHTLHDLHAIIDRASKAEPNLWEEQVAKLIAQELDTRIHYFFTVSTSTNELDWLRKTDGTVDVATTKSHLQASCSPTDWSKYEDRLSNLNIEYFYDTPHGNYGFPTNVGLPYGSAILTCTKATDIKSTDSFAYTTDIPAYGLGDQSFPIANYRYAAEILYYGNSPIRTTDLVKKASDYPSAIDAWNTTTWWSGWEERSVVKSSTRSVAMENNINYGTALLESTVKFADGITSLEDNNSKLHPGEDDQVIPLDGVNFLITGIIVGGQPNTVGWDFTRYPDFGAYSSMTYDANAKHYNVTEDGNFKNNPFDKMIYDRVMTPITLGGRNNKAYTLVFDNYDATKAEDEQSDVYVGLEILNQGEDFWGEMNLVRKNGVFYLLGKLDLSDAIATAQASSSDAFTDLNRDYYRYPPFNPSNGNTINAPRVFMQDYMTKADLVIGKDALKHAYVTVPDLRSGQVSLGVSIDMTWTPGLAFTVPMGQTD